MSLVIGSKLENIKLPSIEGSPFELSHIEGKRALIAFHRFATCPFCNLRIHQLVQSFDNFRNDFTVVAIFDSPLHHLQQHTEGHHAPFAILADQLNTYYTQFGVERSFFKTLIGFIKRIPTVFYSMFIKGYWPFPIKGNVFTMPLEILIDENGRIKYIHRGRDEGDHLPIEDLVNYSNTGALPTKNTR